jgi:hypothetical protein
MVLHNLVNETPLTEVAANFKVPKGTLQSLQQAAATFAGKFYLKFRFLYFKTFIHTQA